MTARPIPDPVSSAPAFIAFSLASVAACFLAGYRIGQYLFDRLTKEQP